MSGDGLRCQTSGGFNPFPSRWKLRERWKCTREWIYASQWDGIAGFINQLPFSILVFIPLKTSANLRLR